jgi:hypothetical protein
MMCRQEDTHLRTVHGSNSGLMRFSYLCEGEITKRSVSRQRAGRMMDKTLAVRY